MIKKLNLTEEHLKLISALRFDRLQLNESNKTDDRYSLGIDQYSLWGGSYPREDIALILGYWDQRDPRTLEDPLGPRFPEKLEKKFDELYYYIYINLYYILSLVLQFSDKGGLTPGTYKCKDIERYWTRVEDDKKSSEKMS